MSGFQYFLPNKTKDQLVEDGKLRREVLAELGLAERCSDLQRVPEHFILDEVHVRKGPGKEQGIMLIPISPNTGAPSPKGNWPDRQFVKPINVNSITVAWIVANKDDLPGPLDLARHAMLFGNTVVDRFGQEWSMPICRTPRAGRLGLPEVFSFGADGAPCSAVQEDHAWAFELSSGIREWYRLAAEGKQTQPFTWIVEQVLRLLSLNYRLGKEEIALLAEHGRGFLTQDFISGLAFACFDFALEEEAKKKPETTGELGAASSSSSTPGEKGDSQAIAPASAG